MRVPEDLKESMDGYRGISWCEVARTVFREEIRKIELADGIASRRESTEDDAGEIGEKVKQRPAERHGKSGLHHREAFNQVVEEAREELGESLKKLVLYGSVAREEHESHSDLDIFAVVENREHKKWLEQRSAEIGVEYSLLISAVVKTEKEYEKIQDSSYAEEVMETGEIHV